jgi:hypothetical protein
VRTVQADPIVEEQPTPAGPPDPLEVWRGTPSTYQVRPPAPGDQVRDVTFLSDGRLAIRVQSGDRYQAWLQDASTGQRSRVADCQHPCALEPDGTVAVVAGTFANEKVTDLSVSPSGAHALIATSALVNGFQHGRLRWVDGSTMREPQDLGPEPVPGSIVWRPDEQAVALMVHSVPTAALMEVGPSVDDGLYLGDASVDGTAGPPVAPVSWSPDLSRRVFGGVHGAAGPSANPLQLFSPASATAFGLLIADGTGIPAVPFGQGGMSPVWLPDGRLLAVGNDNRELVLRLVDVDGSVTPLGRLGIQVSGPSAYAARWDLARHRLLVLVNRIDVLGARDAYLVSYGG